MGVVSVADEPLLLVHKAPRRWVRPSSRDCDMIGPLPVYRL